MSYIHVYMHLIFAKAPEYVAAKHYILVILMGIETLKFQGSRDPYYVN